MHTSINANMTLDISKQGLGRMIGRAEWFNKSNGEFGRQEKSVISHCFHFTLKLSWVSHRPYCPWIRQSYETMDQFFVCLSQLMIRN